MMKKIAILGSTGSIGESSLTVVRHLKERFKITALAAKSSIDILEKQAREFHPELIAVFEEKAAIELQRRLPHIPILSGMDGLKAVASHSNTNFVISAMTGTAGLIPTIAAIEAGKDVGLANKEALVSGGALIMSLVKKHGIKLIPIDSEHSAIFQCLNGEPRSSVHRLILTSSGGPFRAFSKEQLASVTLGQALNHPTWSMGAKVTIDSSTLMNKGLEVIEAHWLFDMPLEKISVVIHPQSIIHSMVEFEDNAIMAQMGEPKMIVPIQYAMTYPERLPGLLQPFDFIKNGTLQFFIPDTDKFRCLRLAFDAANIGGTLPGYMNAANEVLVNRFLDKRICWNDISTKLEDLMSRHQSTAISSVDDILHADHQARQDAAEY